MIAHRLSTVKTADVVAVVDGGVVVEQGTHVELLARPGSVYRSLVERQLESSCGSPAKGGGADSAVGAAAGRRRRSGWTASNLRSLRILIHSRVAIMNE